MENPLSQAAHRSDKVGGERVPRNRQARGRFLANSSESRDLRELGSMVNRAGAHPPVAAEG